MQELMSLIDENSHRVPEGDYIRMCECMKRINKQQNTLCVTPDVVSEDFIMTSDALNKCHKWIMSTRTMRDAFIDCEKDPEDKMKIVLFNQMREATKSFWYEFTHTRGYDELIWFIHRGTIAQRDYRYYSQKK
jgi:hypothetical protein